MTVEVITTRIVPLCGKFLPQLDRILTEFFSVWIDSVQIYDKVMEYSECLSQSVDLKIQPCADAPAHCLRSFSVRGTEPKRPHTAAFSSPVSLFRRDKNGEVEIIKIKTPDNDIYVLMHVIILKSILTCSEYIPELFKN